MNEGSNLSRRHFLYGTSLATVTGMLGGVQLLAQNTQGPDASVPVGARVKVAVIGLGSWGRDILRILARLGLADVAGICDTYASSLRRGATDAPNAKQSDDYKALLADKSIQAVIVATPPHQHREIAIDALKAGKHVYCEVPLAHSLEDARAIAVAAKDAPKLIFQSGLQMRSDVQRNFLLPFIRSGALGMLIMGRAQWHSKRSWRAVSPNAEREKALNWRLSRQTSHGLMGEYGIHQLDQACWFFNKRPQAVTGFKSLVKWKDDGRDVPETVHAIFEFPDEVHFAYEATLASSFDADYEVYHGADAAVMMRENKAWMFKEVDSPLLGWEVYAKKDVFYKETGIALVAGASKQENLTENTACPHPRPEAELPMQSTAIYLALQAFLTNVFEQEAAIRNFVDAYGADDQAALVEHLQKEVAPRRKPAASALDGFQATVTAAKANEAIINKRRLEFDEKWYQLEG